MKINGRDVGFAYTVGVYCDFADYISANPEKTVARATLYEAVLMSQAYNRINGKPESEALTEEELLDLPKYVYDEVAAEMKKAEETGKKRTVEAQEKKEEKASKKM